MLCQGLSSNEMADAVRISRCLPCIIRIGNELIVVLIESIQQLCDVVRDTHQNERTITPVGGNTQPYLLKPMAEDAIAVDLSRLNTLVDYPHDDLTITVQAGMRISELKRLLHAKGQTLPIDVPQEDKATVGGSIAANINGPRRMGWGTWRDYVIGVSWINDQGLECKAGGRVVKNVAGYDFCKLFAGSLGTLGIITQLTLKVKPRVEKRQLVRCIVRTDQLAEVGEYLRYSRVRPVLAVGEPVDRATWKVTLGFEESTAAVDWQVRHLSETGNKLWNGSVLIDGEEADREVWKITQFANEVISINYHFMVPPSCCVELGLQLQKTGHPMQMQPAVGMIILQSPPSLHGSDARSVGDDFRQMAEGMGGNMTVCRREAFWQFQLSTWGDARPEWNLMRKVKQAMDPRGIFQRGRHEILG